MRRTPDPYRGFRFPAEIISHAVWLYHCFSLSLREVETILAQRGIVVSHESIRAWGLQFGRSPTRLDDTGRVWPSDTQESPHRSRGTQWRISGIFGFVGSRARMLPAAWRAGGGTTSRSLPPAGMRRKLPSEPPGVPGHAPGLR